MDDPVQSQLDAFNEHDLDGFLAAYREDAVVTDGTGAESIRGLDAMRSAYSALFERFPDVHADVPHRVAAGGWTVDEEHVTRGGESFVVLVAYHVCDGLIDRVLLLQE